MSSRTIIRNSPLLIALAAASLAAGCSEAIEQADPQPEVATGGKADIYDIDDRGETYQASRGTTAYRLAQASAMLTDSDTLVEVLGEEEQLSGYRLAESVQTLGEAIGLCDGVRFAEQPRVGFCSATLVAPDLVATSGHCIADEGATPEQARCADMKIVFGFGYESPADDAMGAFENIPADNVYGCKKVEAIGWKRLPANEDWALVRLERPVVDRAPVPVLTTRPAVGAQVLQIGHPTGIPQKFAPGVVTDESGVEDFEEFVGNTFVYNSDLFGGNSGGGVFEMESASLAGMPTLYSGQNFVYDDDRQCSVTGVCGDNVECAYPPGAYGTFKMLESLGEGHPLIDELERVGESAPEPGPEVDAGSDAGFDAGSNAGDADAGM